MKINRFSKILTVVAIVTVMFCAAPIMEHFGIDMGISAHAAKSGYYTYSVSNKEATITKVDSSINGDVTIPDKLGGYPVTKIASGAFQTSSIGTLTIGKNITEVFTDSFFNSFIRSFYVVPENPYFSSDSNGCLYLKGEKVLVRYPTGNMSKTFSVPEGVETISSWAFANAIMLTEIYLPESVKKIGSVAFANCIVLDTINLPDSVTRIENSTFCNCYMLSQITLPSKCEYIGKEAFTCCVNLKKVTIPKTVKQIDDNAFDFCVSLTQVEIQSRSVVFGENAVCMSRTLIKDGCSVKDLTTNLVMMSACELTGDSDSEEYKGYRQGFIDCLDVHEYYIPYGTILCYDDSTAETYAIKNDIDHQHLHTNKTKTTKATTSKNGKTVKYCTDCGETTSSKTIYKISTIKLSKTSYTYDGKVKTPSVVVKDSKGNTLKKDTDYTVSYASGRKAVGTYKVTVTFKGKYSGSKTLSFKIVLGKVTGIKSSKSGNKTTITWNSVKGATGYEVYEYKPNTGKYEKILTCTKNAMKNTYLGKNYSFKIRAFYKAKNGTIHYGAYSSKTTVKI